MVRLRNTVQRGLHFGAESEFFLKAQELRRKMTEAEKELWKHLRNRKFHGLKFRRQHPIKYFIADFYCHEDLLVIEIDGSVHEDGYQSERDENRTLEMEKLGFTVVRFTNDQVLKETEQVLRELEELVG
jgi:very-short-patch-repair endonuclease